MDEIHSLIESKGYQLVMSGSSARKFRRGNVNLLGGRAWRLELYPLVTKELEDFNLDRAFITDLIPPHYLPSDSDLDLKAYTHGHLREEIQAEALTMNLPAFSFLIKNKNAQETLSFMKNLYPEN